MPGASTRVIDSYGSQVLVDLCLTSSDHVHMYKARRANCNCAKKAVRDSRNCEKIEITGKTPLRIVPTRNHIPSSSIGYCVIYLQFRASLLLTFRTNFHLKLG
jgi:hypothetical protein